MFLTHHPPILGYGAILIMNQNDVMAGVTFSADPMKQILFKTENYKVVRNCLKKGIVLPPHTEDHSVLFLVLQGKGIFTTETGEVELTTNGFVQIKKDEIRGIQSLEDLVVLVVTE